MTDEVLKSAISIGEVTFLTNNLSKYSINHQFLDEDGDTLLMYSLSDNSNESYKFFLEMKASLNCKNNLGENILHSIVYSGDKKRLIFILDNYKININQKTIEGVTPLLLSVLLSDFDLFNLLVEYGANIHLADNGGSTPLHVASSLGLFNIVTKLIDLGSNYQLKTLKGNLPLALAVNADHHEIVKYLFQIIYKAK